MTSVELTLRTILWSTTLVALLLLFTGGCLPAAPSPKVFTGQTMGTTYTVKVADTLEDAARRDLETAIAQALEDVDAKMSTYRADSELSRCNRHSSTEPFQVSAETAEVFRIAIEVGRQSNGAFDITVGHLVNLWGFGPQEPGLKPDDATITRLREQIGYQYLEVLDGNRLRKQQPEGYCDLSAVAKGYGVDRVAAALDQRGVANYMIEVGGEVRVKGNNAAGTPWRIGIEKPSAGERAVQRIIALRDKSLATSGDYRNFTMRNGVRLSHTIDPQTGRPITHGLASVSVIHQECAWADAYATAIMVLGPEKGYAFAAEQNLPAYLIIHEGEAGFTEKSTPAFETYALR